MSDNNNAALALFAECESLFQSLSPTDESNISGGRWHKKHKKGNKRNKRNKRRNSCACVCKPPGLITLPPDIIGDNPFPMPIAQ